MSIRICICDDNIEDIKILKSALYSYDDSFQIFSYTNGDFLLGDLLEGELVADILFLDIYMPNINGIEVARKIREKIKDIKIIFISSSNEYYPESYDVFAFNYIIKPVNKEKLNNILNQAFLCVEYERGYQISFSYKSTNFRIYCKDILYIESSDKIIYFHLIDKSILQCYSKLNEIDRQLPEELFIRCHQSYVVNISHITEMSDNYFRVGSSLINISKKYKKTAKDKYFSYLFDHINRGN